MRHQKSGRKFDRNASSRRAMFRNLAANLVLHERIETTEAKAKELRRIAERLVTRATRLGKTAFTEQAKLDANQKAQRLHATRLVGSFIGRFGTRTLPGGELEKIDLVEKVFTDLAKRFEGRAGGYTRIIKLGPRRGDGAEMSLIEWVVRTEPANASVASFSAAAPAAQADTSAKADAPAAKAPKAKAAKSEEAPAAEAKPKKKKSEKSE